MKRLLFNTGKNRPKQIACSISAAALMLGCSHGATIGFNFQTHYCSVASYSGTIVTATAFGISSNSWQNLSQMDTGYGCSPGPFVLNQVIDTTPAADGLNPLPNGSLNVTWSGYVANVSGFGGYDHYSGNNYAPGEEQVYWGFIRDGVNFGPGSSGGNNDQPGWSVDITGLKSVFTNSSFVVEAIGAGDSISALTNVFIIDATLSTTQSVIYPNIPPISNVGDTAWPRGIGGGLSTGSGAVNTDHLQITGNRAQHGGSGSTGYNNASQVAGFIITDKPVVTMPPQPVLAGPGDSITLNPYAIGVPPLAYQWRLNGVAVPGATNVSYSIASLSTDAAGNYDLMVTNNYGSVTSRVAAVTEDMLTLTGGTNFVADSNPANAPRVGLNYGATWLASSSDGTESRSGVMQFVATNANLITVAGTTNFDAPAGTIMFWMRSAGTDINAPGTTGAALFGRPSSTTGNDFILVQGDEGSIHFNAPANKNNPANTIYSVAAVNDNQWHFIALTFDQSAAGGVALYIDGALDTTNANYSAWSGAVGKQLELGSSSDAVWRSYDGLMDDVRFYSRELSASEIASVYNTDALVDTANLQMELNFDAAPGAGFAISWLMNQAVLQSATNVEGPYTDIPAAPSPYNITANTGQKFYRYRFTHQVLTSNPYLM